MVLYIYSFFCVRPFDQELGSPLIYFFYLYATIRQKYMVHSHLIFILYTTIRPKIRVFIDFFLSCAHDHSTEICCFLILFLLCTTIRRRLRVLTYLFFLYAHNHLIKICGPLPFIITFVHDHSTKKIRVLIYIFISFVHDHSTKIRGHSYSLIYSLLNRVYGIFRTLHSSSRTALIFRTLCPWIYQVGKLFDKITRCDNRQADGDMTT